MRPSSFPPNSSVAGRPDPHRSTGWPTPGETLDSRYRLLERIGAGGMSVIWRAVDLELGRPVAIKLPGPDQGVPVDRDALARNEARTVAAVSHPDAVVVHDVGQVIAPDGTTMTYLVLQMLTGESLLDVLATGPVDWHRAVGIAARLASVLAAVHAQGVVHRDVTPDNVMVADTDVKLLDFGIAARIGDRPHADWTFGTPPYVAPERLADAPADPATDIYSLGVLLVEMLTGQPPDGPYRLPVDVPAELTRLCQRCLEPEPARRPSAAEAAADLAALAGPALPTPPRPETIFGPTAPLDPTVTAAPAPADVTDARRRQLSTAVATMVTLTVLMVATAVILLSRSPSPPPPAPMPLPAAPWPPPASSPSRTAPSTASPRPVESARKARTDRPARSRTAEAATPTAATPVASPALSLTRAADELRGLLQRGVTDGTVSPDTARRVGAQVDNVMNNQGAQPENLSQLVTDLRRGVADEIRDGRVSPAVVPALDAAVDRVGAAVDGLSPAPD